MVMRLVSSSPLDAETRVNGPPRATPSAAAALRTDAVGSARMARSIPATARDRSLVTWRAAGSKRPGR
jgi:hypothetical protein